MSKRTDAVGFFWEDLPPVKPPKVEKVKRTPPERTWERDDYLPGLQEALAFPVPLMTDGEILQASWSRERVVCDVEIYQNYFLVAFMSLVSGKVFYVEATNQTELDIPKLKWILENFCIVTFNGRHFDVPILAMACAGKSIELLKIATNLIIAEEEAPKDVLKKFKVKNIKPDHIDLNELAPLNLSLKLCAGRLHTMKMQDLPFHPDRILTDPQIAITRWYCVNDLRSTEILYRELEPEIKLRESMGKEYNLDLRSKSDAQIAEAVIEQEVQKLNGYRAKKPTIPPGTVYRYKVPAFLQFRSELMRWVLDRVANTMFIVGEYGNIEKPPELDGLKFQMGQGVYSMGIGGLHSTEKGATHVCDGTFTLDDIDVASNYPRIILNQKLYPGQLGPNFLRVYNGIVERRLEAKARGDKLVADSLKITINGSYGKLGSVYSILYAPDLLVQVTLTGQLALLMLIERLELAGIPVVSANTDGIVVKCPTVMQDIKRSIVAEWCRDTGFETEENHYKALYSRDVNNYIAVKTDGKTKQKGVYGNSSIDKNPAGQICIDAVTALLTKGTPIYETIIGCKDIRKFVFVRTVKGGAVKDGEYLGKQVRWYYGSGETGEIVYAKSGNKVSETDGAVPALELPDEFPENLDFDWYINRCEKILVNIGYAS